MRLPRGPVVKNLPSIAGDMGSILVSGKIPHAEGPLSPWATTTEPARPEPALCNKRNHRSEKPVHRSGEEPQLAATAEKPERRNEDKGSQKNQFLKKEWNLFKKKKKGMIPTAL